MPLVAAGAMSQLEIERFESNFISKQGLIPNDISSNILLNVNDNFSAPVFDFIRKLAVKNRLFVKDDMRAPDYKAKSLLEADEVDEAEQKNQGCFNATISNPNMFSR